MTPEEREEYRRQRWGYRCFRKVKGPCKGGCAEHTTTAYDAMLGYCHSGTRQEFMKHENPKNFDDDAQILPAVGPDYVEHENWRGLELVQPGCAKYHMHLVGLPKCEYCRDQRFNFLDECKIYSGCHLDNVCLAIDNSKAPDMVPSADFKGYDTCSNSIPGCQQCHHTGGMGLRECIRCEMGKVPNRNGTACVTCNVDHCMKTLFGTKAKEDEWDRSGCTTNDFCYMCEEGYYPTADGKCVTDSQESIPGCIEMAPAVPFFVMNHTDVRVKPWGPV